MIAMEIQDPAIVSEYRNCGSGIDYGICPKCQHGHGYVIRLSAPHKPGKPARIAQSLATACEAAERHWHTHRDSIIADPSSPQSTRYSALLTRCHNLKKLLTNETKPA